MSSRILPSFSLQSLAITRRSRREQDNKRLILIEEKKKSSRRKDQEQENHQDGKAEKDEDEGHATLLFAFGVLKISEQGGGQVKFAASQTTRVLILFRVEEFHLRRNRECMHDRCLTDLQKVFLLSSDNMGGRTCALLSKTLAV